jgi:hypothetical protein
MSWQSALRSCGAGAAAGCCRWLPLADVQCVLWSMGAGDKKHDPYLKKLIQVDRWLSDFFHFILNWVIFFEDPIFRGFI